MQQPRRSDMQWRAKRRQTHASLTDQHSNVIVVATTNRLNSIDPRIRRAGRFNAEIRIGFPNVKSRQDLLQVLTASMKLPNNYKIETSHLALGTCGYTCAELKAIVKLAAYHAACRHWNEQKKRKGEQAEVESPRRSRKLRKFSEEESSATEDTTLPKPPPTAGLSTAGTSTASTSTAEASTSAASGTPEGYRSIPGSTGSVKSFLGSEMLSWIDKVPFTDTELAEIVVKEIDFNYALRNFMPSYYREGYTSMGPYMSANQTTNVSSLDLVADQLKNYLVNPFDEVYRVTSHVLLWGPPGCGKTDLAKSILHEKEYVWATGPELLSMYPGEGEKAVEAYFERARNLLPCVMVFDEFDLLCPRVKPYNEDGGASERIVNQMRKEMDAANREQSGIVVLAITRRPDMVDPSLLYSGRLDKLLYVGTSTRSERENIFRRICRGIQRPRVSSKLALSAFKHDMFADYVTADIVTLTRDACNQAFHECIRANKSTNWVALRPDHVTAAAKKIKLSFPKEDRELYANLLTQYPSHITKPKKTPPQIPESSTSQSLHRH